MALWLLTPITDPSTDKRMHPSTRWRGRSFGLLVRAKDEHEARDIAQEQDEFAPHTSFWTLEDFSFCEMIDLEGESELILADIAVSFPS